MKSLRDLNVLDLYGDIFPMIMTQQIRYNNRHRIHNEDLAQHSFMVAFNILKIGYNYPQIPKDKIYKACSMAIVHDAPETFTSDVPHDCKQKHPELKDMLSSIEHEFVDNETPELKELFDEYSTGDSLAALLVELGDAISVLQYVNREIIHGNIHEDMQIIKNEVSLRIVKLFDKLNKRVKNLSNRKIFRRFGK